MSGPLRILIVEDDEVDKMSVIRDLRETAPQIQHTTATTLSTALEHLRARMFDVVVLDIGLPDALGSAASTVSIVCAAAQDARLVVIAGQASTDTVHACSEAGADTILLKSRTAGQPTIPPLGVYLHTQALVARRERRIRGAIVAPSSSGDDWWDDWTPVQRGALAVAGVTSVTSLIAEVLRQIPDILEWLGR